MNAEQFESYQFKRLYSIDFDSALHTLRIIKRYRREETRNALLRELAVAYSRPFSKNRGENLIHHELSHKHVPSKYKALHKELLRLRNEQFAHTDIKYYSPKVARFGSKESPWFPMAFKSYNYSALLSQVNEIGLLINAVVESLNQELVLLESSF